MTTTKQVATREAIRTLSASEIDAVSGAAAGILALIQVSEFKNSQAAKQD